MSILFLDHDGVLCLEQNWGTRQKNGEDFDDFDKGAIQVLNEILNDTNADIVVSSDWRHHLSLASMSDLYFKRGIIWTPIGYTINVKDEKGLLYLETNRVKEIQLWLDCHNMQGAKWCAVDDMDLSALGDEHFVQCTHSREGIKQTGIKEKIIKRLL